MKLPHLILAIRPGLLALHMQCFQVKKTHTVGLLSDLEGVIKPHWSPKKMLEDSLSARELHKYILPPDTRKFSICPDQSEHTTKELTCSVGTGSCKHKNIV